MKRIKYILPIVLFGLVTNVKAIDACTTEEMSRVRELANQIEIKTNYRIEEDEERKKNGASDYLDVIYTIDVVNLSEDLKIYYKNISDIDSIELDPTELQDTEFSEGQKIKFDIYSYTTNLCTNEFLKSITIEFPVYSRYYYVNKEKCVENPEFEYCKEFQDNGDKSIEEIDKLLEEYKNKKTDNSENEIKNELLNNYSIIIAIGIVVIVILFIIIKVKKKKNEDL